MLVATARYVKVVGIGEVSMWDCRALQRLAPEGGPAIDPTSLSDEDADLVADRICSLHALRAFKRLRQS